MDDSCRCWHFDGIIYIFSFLKLIINPNDQVLPALRELLGCDYFLKIVNIEESVTDGLGLHFFDLEFRVRIEEDFRLVIEDGIFNDRSSSLHDKSQQVKWLLEANAK